MGRAVKRSPLSWALLLSGLVATVAMLVYVSRVATRRVQAASRQRALDDELRDADPASKL